MDVGWDDAGEMVVMPELTAHFAFVTAFKRLQWLLDGGEPAWGAEPYCLLAAVYGAWGL